MATALISAVEGALFSLKPEELDSMARSRDLDQKRVAEMMKNPRLVVTALTTVKYALLLCAAVLAMSSVSWRASVSLDDFSIVTWLVLLTACFSIAGVIVPKIFGASRARSFAVKYRLVVSTVIAVMKPFVSPILRMSNVVEQRLYKKREEDSVKEFSQALQLATIDEEPVEGSREILEGIVNFGTLRVKSVMRARSEISFIDRALDFDQLIEFVRISGYSRIPVCDGSLDQIAGLLYIKDLLPFLDEPATFDWRKLIRPAYFVNEAKKIDVLLKEFQEKRVHIALVINPEGKVSGLITLEDIIEEIIGDINDEFDEIGVRFQRLNENTWLFDGKTSVHDFCKVLSVDPKAIHRRNGFNESLSAMIMASTGKFPTVGERINIGDLTFVVEAVDQKRIKKVRVYLRGTKVF